MESGGNPVLVIGGPTASGKSSLALEVARRLNGIVLNADSMQIYEGLPILTAQPSQSDRQERPHILYEALSPDDVCSAARWRKMALAEIEKAHAQDLLPVVTGGTGFYLKTLLEGISPIPDVPPEIRRHAAALQKEMGNPGFHAELEKRDPKTAAKLDPFNTQRVVRAMEVLEHTGRPLAEWQEIPRERPPAHLRFRVVTLLPPRAALYRNCDSRFNAMLAKGAEAEAEAFLARIARGEIRKDAPLAKALGFPEIAAWISGKTDRDEAAAAAKLATRHYAKRQVTWFRRQIKADLALEEPDAQRVVEELAF